MITKEQYDDARQIVAEYENQEYAAALERAKNEFPRGSHVKHSETCVRGVVYGYGRFQSDVMLKIADDKGMYPTRISVKYAKKIE